MVKCSLTLEIGYARLWLGSWSGRAVLAEYFEEPRTEEILETMRQSLGEGLAGKVRPVDELLAELKAEVNAWLKKTPLNHSESPTNG